MRRCPICGRETSALSATCPSCGQPLVALEPAQPAEAMLATPVVPEGQPAPPEGAAAAAPPSAPAQLYPGYPGYPGYPPYGPYAPYPGYQPYPTQGYPSYPAAQEGMPPSYPAYPAGYPYPYGYAMPSAPLSPAAKPAKKGVWVWLSVALAGVVILAMVVAGLALAVSNRPNTIGIVPPAASPTNMPTATATPQTITIYKNTLKSSADGWYNGQHCFFRADGYHVQGGWQCYVPTSVSDNYTLTIQVKAIKGTAGDPFGINFRHGSSDKTDYYFLIGIGGEWSVSKCPGDSCSNLIPLSTSSALQTGLNTVNTLEVEVRGTHFAFYANNTLLGQANDTAYTPGWVGLVSTGGAESVFSNIDIEDITN